MKNPLFKISKLACSYSHKEEDKVLYIEDLELPKGEIIFLLGASGSGKSTLLETLGLMNDTFADGSVEFFPDQTGQAIRLEDLWYSEEGEKLSGIRRNHFSFIFQNTNLMESFTAYENICLAPMIQDSSMLKDSLGKATEMMERVNIPVSQVGYNTLSVNLSGGQRQRVAFVRALMARYTVLFCDEPTGNLDEKNAGELMALLNEAITPDTSVIIVSHDINLALAHATMLVCMSRDEEAGCSVVRPRDVFRRSDWGNLNPEEFKRFRERVFGYYENVEDVMKGKEDETVKELPGGRSNYSGLFRSREGRILRGKRFVNLFVIAALLLVTFLSVGFANGSLEYLETKMKNPFVMWITMKVPASRTGLGGDVDDIIRSLNSAELRSQFNIQAVSGYSELLVRFVHNESGKYTPKRLRTIDPGTDKMIRDVLSPANFIRGDSAGFNSPKDFGIICTQRFLTSLGLDENASFVPMINLVTDTSGVSMPLFVPIPVRSVVKELPGTIEVMVTPAFSTGYFTRLRGPFDVRFSSELVFYVPGTEEDAKKAADALMTVVDKIVIPGAQPEIAAPSEHTLSSGGGYDVRVIFYGTDYELEKVDEAGKTIMESAEVNALELPVSRIYDFSSFAGDLYNLSYYDAISINLSSLDKVRELSEHVFDTYNSDESASLIEMDITKVREKENYNFMSKITLVISWLVIIFGSLSVGLFIFNLLKMHLSKVSTTLGTFKAFGLQDKRATGIYFAIIFRFLLIAFLIASVGAVGLGFALNAMLQKIFVLEFGVDYFLINHMNTYLTVLIMVTTAFGVSWITIRQILNRTPGDLIYRR